MAERPNILILMTDQQRADCLSAVGHPQLRTPNTERIAASGVLFTQAATVSPVCMPARASFVNSLYPHNHGMWRNRGCMQPEDDTFFQHLQGAGYCTALIGKSHYYAHGKGHMADYLPYMYARGLEYVHEVTGPLATQFMRSHMTDYLEEHGLYEAFKRDYADRRKHREENPFLVRRSPLPAENFLDSYVGRRAEEYLSQYADSRPLCLFVGFPGPHEPWDAPGEYASMYDPDRAPEPIPPSDPGSLPESIRDMDDFHAMGSYSQESARKVRTNYYGKISLIDHWIGRILDVCDERGMLEDTITVFWSDHGDMLGDHGRVFKCTFFESSMRVPLMVSWPARFRGGRTSDALAETVDVYPTLMDLLGLEVPERCQGRSLSPVLLGSKTEVRESQLSEIEYRDEKRLCLRTGRRKYAVRQNGDGFMLFDLEEDPEESRNLIGQNAELEHGMREMLLRKLVGTQHHKSGCQPDPKIPGLLRPF
jgi:arylsulfatase A-like enzyme